MSSDYSLSHLSDPDLLSNLSALVARERAATAELLAHIAEVDARKLFREAAYPSMFAYCVGELHLSEDAAYRHITAARAARRFPMLYDAIADGRLHLSAILLLAVYLTPETIEDLVAAAAYRNKVDIERLLAERFPRPDVLASIRVVPPGVTEAGPFALARSGELAPEPVVPGDELAPERVGHYESSAPGRMKPGPHPSWPAPPARRANVWPLSSRRFALRVTIGEVTHGKLRYAQELLSHQSVSGDVAALLDRALSALIAQLEKRKFAETSRPREGAASRGVPRALRAGRDPAGGVAAGRRPVHLRQRVGPSLRGAGAARVRPRRRGRARRPGDRGRECACAAGPTTSSRRSAPSAPSS